MPKNVPLEPGVYIFTDENKKPLYVGKASNLRKRLVWYFLKQSPERVLRLREEARSLSLETTETEYDALVREAGFEKLEMDIDPWGIFTVSLAQRDGR